MTVGDLGTQVQQALAALRALDAAESGKDREERRADLVHGGPQRVWAFMVQREICGLRHWDAVVREHELTKTFARELVDTVFGMITSAAQKGEEVSLFGFGRFKVAEHAARKGRNPRTGEAVKIAASKNLKFTPARSLKTSLNAKRRSSKKAK